MVSYVRLEALEMGLEHLLGKCLGIKGAFCLKSFMAGHIRPSIRVHSLEGGSKLLRR